MSEWEAGEALDAEIAVKVLGCQPRERTNHGYRMLDGSEYVTGHKTPIWSPFSTNIAAAWYVAERFPEMVLEHLCDGWYCWLGTAVADPSQASTVACATAPLAICRAALASIGEQP